MSTAAEKTAALLAALWQRNRPLVEERVAVLDRAAEAASAGTLTLELREEAAETAHKLAGSLGMYGFPQGTRVARELEVLLDYRTPDAVRVMALTVELRRALFPEA